MTIPADTVCLSDYERYFHQRVNPAIRAYIAGAAADGITQRANRAAFDRLTLMPRALVDMSGATTRIELFGQPLEYPIIVAPMAFHKLVHSEGEVATARAASLARTWMTVSTLSSCTIEDIAATASMPLLFQLYMQPRKDDTLTLVRRAENAGYKAIMVTVDAPVNGVRNAEQRAGFRLPPDISAVNLAGMAGHDIPTRHAGSPIFQGMLANAPTWSDIDWLRGQTSLPIVLKGIINPQDALRSLSIGMDGIVVSNHGGRTLDGLPASVDALASVTEAIAGRVPILFDGGIRRGTDIVKALALGANAVMIGQPVLHALAVGGISGVAHALTILQTEMESAMALLGAAHVVELNRGILDLPCCR